ncbi:hypothetical protein LCGC14_0643030 [marine sediment metagenome]|uniref:Uncharacterized protein n=1 Tax=marine sediment metagenome TaxID=412755 RepID=A0A0F9U6Z6_9ZZZZ
MAEPRWVSDKKKARRMEEGFIHCKNKSGEKIFKGYDANRAWMMVKPDPKPVTSKRK